MTGMLETNLNSSHLCKKILNVNYFADESYCLIFKNL